MDRARYGRLVYGNERHALSDTGKGGMALSDRSRFGMRLAEEVYTGGVERTHYQSTLAPGPTAVMGCKMYLATQEQEYLDWAIKCYDYMLDVLQDKSDHLFYDNVRPNKDDPNLPGDLEKNKYSYNSGQPLQSLSLI